MALVRTNIGTRPDGSPLYHYRQTDSDTPVVLTGPATGEVTVADGTTYSVSEPVIEVAAGHEGEVAHHIAVQLQDSGHPDHAAGEPFVHDCTEACGPARRDSLWHVHR